MNAIIERVVILPIFRLYFDPTYDGGSGASGVEFNTNTTTQESLSDEMRTYYSDYLLDLVEPELVHEQFAQKHPIPKNGGKTINFRMFDPLPELTTPLVEGVTPAGQSLSVSSIEAYVDQYGGYVTLSDMLMMTAVDPMLMVATKKIATQAGQSRDTLVREVMAAGTNVRYAGGAASRSALAVNTSKLTVEDIRKAVRDLEANDVPRINGKYIGIIHPNVKYDLMDDPRWLNPHEYRDTSNVYTNEIGEIYGVRFVEASRAKIWKGEGASGADVYGTIILGDDAYGVTEIDGGIKHIVKQLGSGGTSDALDQRATCGWKMVMVTKILIQQYMVRIESTATP